MPDKNKRDGAGEGNRTLVVSLGRIKRWYSCVDILAGKKVGLTFSSEFPASVQPLLNVQPMVSAIAEGSTTFKILPKIKLSRP